MADSSKKDTIYIDIDDEITTIIEKVRASNEKIVALVLPKRATVLQSIVNMKLLKRSAEEAKKSLVLITSEAGLMPLAGSVGLYVAKNLQTKPEVPPAPGAEESEEIAEEPLEDTAEDAGIDTKTAGNRPIGELAGTAAVTGAAKDEPIETLELDNEEEPAATAAGTGQTPKPKKDKKLKVPNFNRFRMLLVLGVLALIIIIGGLITAAKVLPKATITLTTDTSNVNSNLTLNLDKGAQSLDAASLTLPAQIKSVQKSQQQQVPTTGQQNNGQKATGSVTMTECVTSPSQLGSVPAGTGISTNGLTYITQKDANFSWAGSCNGSSFKFQSNDIDITAQNAGTKYNTSLNNASVAGYSGVSADGSASGGTDDIIQVVSQADIDSATNKIAAQDTSAIKKQLEQELQQAGLFAINATFNAGTPTTTTSSKVGDQASTVTVTQATTYTMFGVKKSDLKELVDNDVKDQIDPSKQSILSEGLDTASFRVNNQNASSAQVAMSTTGTAGPDLDKTAIKKEVAGHKSGEITVMLKNNPGVVSVKVHLSPFWVTAAPSNPDKINVVFQKAAK